MKKHADGTLPKQTHHVWVFGSNLLGVHGAGAAKVAHQIYGRPYGTEFATNLYVSGNLQESWGIPTKDMSLNTLPIDTIKLFVDAFTAYVIKNPTKEFFVTRVGCGLAGYKDEEIAPLFSTLRKLPNISFCESWCKILGEEYVL